MKRRVRTTAFLDRQRQERESLQEARRLMRQAVWRRNLQLTCDRFAPAGRCDGCGRAFKHVQEGELDHWISRGQGGVDDADNGWRLCSDCHRAKTDNAPPPPAQLAPLPGSSAVAEKKGLATGTWDWVRYNYCVQAKIPYVARRKIR